MLYAAANYVSNLCAVVPWEQVSQAALAAAQPKPESPPPTFASATASSLTDKREVINDSSQGEFSRSSLAIVLTLHSDIWDDNAETDFGPSRAGTPGPDSGLSTPGVSTGPTVGPMRTRMPHGVPGETIEMISAPVARRAV